MQNASGIFAFCEHRMFWGDDCVIQEYPVYQGQEQIGKVRLEKQGLYYRLSCRCAVKDGMHRLTASCGEKQENLGILLPMGDGFGMDTRLPVKRLGEGKLHFRIQHNNAGTFVPICPEEPFSYIERLKKSFLEIKDGQKGIYVD